MSKFDHKKYNIRYKGETYYQQEGRGGGGENDIWYEDYLGNTLEVNGTRCRTMTPWASAHEEDRKLFHKKVKKLIKKEN